MRVLVTGGAGFIGSHTAKALARAGYEPVVYDNLSVGRRCNVKWGPLIHADLGDRRQLDQALCKFDIEAVIHFAAHASVGESMQEPRRYFHNNVANTLVLLDALLEADVNTFVFSSSCAVYGVPQVVPIPESHPTCPVNPYGESKLFTERVLDWYGAAYGLRTACLRYFNAAGADPEGELGEAHDPETHIIPLVVEAALGRREGVDIYGTDYPTRDGTAVRDFVHVSDLADAHVSALNCLLEGQRSFSANLGSGAGTSVLEVIDAVEKLVRVSIKPRHAARRVGDPPILVADPSRAMNLLGWQPKHSEIGEIVYTALNWHRTRQLAAAAVPQR
jgi:UDP-glucose-4-epimerase GalE